MLAIAKVFFVKSLLGPKLNDNASMSLERGMYFKIFIFSKCPFNESLDFRSHSKPPEHKNYNLEPTCKIHIIQCIHLSVVFMYL